MKGHAIANCRNPLTCGKCWKMGHTGNRCRKQFPDAQAKPYVPEPINEDRAEPMFDELLTGSYPYNPPVMPANRPDEVTCFIDRDMDYFIQANKLQRAVVMQVTTIDMELDIDEVAELAMQTKLVQREEITIGTLTKARFIISLPEGMAPQTFIDAIPASVWRIGVSFQPWSPLIDGVKMIPRYKALIDLVGVPMDLWRESAVIRAVSKFGLYLGTVSNKNPSHLEKWRVAIAIDDLLELPRRIAVVVGGVKRKVQIYPTKVIEAPIYKESEMPRETEVFTGPPLPATPSDSSDEDHPDLLNHGLT